MSGIREEEESVQSSGHLAFLVFKGILLRSGCAIRRFRGSEAVVASRRKTKTNRSAILRPRDSIWIVRPMRQNHCIYSAGCREEFNQMKGKENKENIFIKPQKRTNIYRTGKAANLRNINTIYNII